MWLLQCESAGPRGGSDPNLGPSCAGELAGLRQQMTTAEEKVALDKELMAQKLVQAEREAQTSLREQRAAHEEDLQRLQREKVRAAGRGRQGSAAVSPLCPLATHPPHSASVSQSVRWNFISVPRALRAAVRIHWGCLIKHADSQAPNLVPPW